MLTLSFFCIVLSLMKLIYHTIPCSIALDVGRTLIANLTIIREISVVGGWALSGTVSISKKTVHTIRSKLDQCVAPNLTTCLLYLSVYGCCKLTELNDFLVVFYKLRIIGNFADDSAICCIIGGRHRAVLTEGRNREQLADNCRADHPDFTVCNNIIRYVYRAEFILGR